MHDQVLQAGMFGIGPQEMLFVMVIVLLLFGPKNLPKLASSMGRAIRDFKSGLAGVDEDLHNTMNDVNADPAQTKAATGQVRDVRTGEAKTAEAPKHED